jgi:uncharacterized protein (TIGR00255 family)
MTGYAYREIQDEGLTLSVEIRGYNSRYLELSLSLPPWLSGLEPGIRTALQSRFGRGKIEVSVKLRESGEALEVSINTEAAKAYKKAVTLLAAELKLAEEVSLPLILGMEGVLAVDRKRDNDRYWKLIEPLLEKAARDFEAERDREGKHTEEDILAHIGILEHYVSILSVQASLLEDTIKENLRGRFVEMLGERLTDIDENRILAETAVLLMKNTISEEISRLTEHLQEFRAETERNPRPGKKLDFLCQEINREVNTIGSKTAVLEVSRVVVEMKDALENIREQLRNVE